MNIYCTSLDMMGGKIRSSALSSQILMMLCQKALTLVTGVLVGAVSGVARGGKGGTCPGRHFKGALKSS